jgi:hypothetical protein
MSTVLGIDPGSTHSAYALINSGTCRVIEACKVPNDAMERILRAHSHNVARVAIEWIQSYGMTVGAEVFDTCREVGRLQHIAEGQGCIVTLVPRRVVKLHHCGTSKAKDPNVTAALVDRFAPGEPNRGKGTKADPGWFYGFAADVWQAYAVAVLQADVVEGRQDTVGVA